MKNNRAQWQDASLEKRMAVYECYARHSMAKEGYAPTWEQCNTGWHDCWWDVIYFTFGKDEYYRD